MLCIGMPETDRAHLHHLFYPQGESSHASRGHTTSQTTMNSHPAETSSRAPNAPFGSGVATANDVNSHVQQQQFHHPIPDKSGSIPVVTDASARGQTVGKDSRSNAAGNGQGRGGASSVAAPVPSTATAPTNAQIANAVHVGSGGGGGAGGSGQYTKEAQQIVEEERAAAEKLPVYPGLQERFTLLAKMGE